MFADLVPFHAGSLGTAIRLCVGMLVVLAIHPGPLPRMMVDEDLMRAPAKAAAAPAPGRECSAQINARTETDGAPDEESSSRRREHYKWIVTGDENVVRIHRVDHDRAGSFHHHAVLRIAPEIAVVVSLLALMLHGIHYVGTLIQHRVPERLRPAGISGHHVQHGRKR